MKARRHALHRWQRLSQGPIGSCSMEMGTPAVPATFGTAITSCQHSAWEVRMSAVSEGLYARLHPAMRGLVLFYGEQTLEPRGSLKILKDVAVAWASLCLLAL